MEFTYYNPNPKGQKVGDCSVRAVAKALDIGWDEAFLKLAVSALALADMPSSDVVWGDVLRCNGFGRTICPDCYNAEKFCNDHPSGTFVLAFGGHVATVVNGILYDSWDSSGLVPQYFWYRKE
jgi:hypothetical protein